MHESTGNLKDILLREFKLLFQFKKTERPWHVPVLASVCMGVPLLMGYYIGRLDYGIQACVGGLVFLYLPTTRLEHRMITLLLCAFGFIVSFTIGIAFSFNPFISAAVLGIYAFGLNWVTNYFKLQPPGNFFFLMLASMASCVPFDLITIPTKIGLIALGTIFASIIALIYSLYITSKQPYKIHVKRIGKGNYVSLSESMIIGVFAAISLLLGHILQFDNPYWIPISCLAIMQGVSIANVWQRSCHRILGTFAGMGLAWLFFQFNLTPLNICIGILVLQFIIEILVVRNYALAMFFITPMTVLLADLGKPLTVDPNRLLQARLIDIVIGSLLGLVGGWMLHNQQLHQQAERQMRRTRVAMRRR